MFIRLRERGDSIVEVLISIAIISLVLTTAYVTTNRNVIGIQEVQEHSQALKYVQGQVEFLRAQGFFNSNDYCFSQTGAVVSKGPIPTVPPAACTIGNASLGQVSYVLSVQNPVAGQAFKASVTWTTIHNGSAEITEYYRP